MPHLLYPNTYSCLHAYHVSLHPVLILYLKPVLAWAAAPAALSILKPCYWLSEMQVILDNCEVWDSISQYLCMVGKQGVAAPVHYYY
jgi:hypothetical protein